MEGRRERRKEGEERRKIEKTQRTSEKTQRTRISGDAKSPKTLEIITGEIYV
jgi:hypothetical protein